MSEIVKYDFFKNKEVLITGGTGSLGHALVTALNNGHPKGVRVYSRDEYKQWKMKSEISVNYPIAYLIGDVRDKDRLSRAVNGVDIVIHTAALKHVPICENDPMEAIKTNIVGATNVIEAAIDNDVSAVMNVSTDKAVYPINLYGMTKAVAEKLFVFADIYSPHSTKFCSCRYGNVLNSRGSIIPLLKAAKKAGKVSLTDPNMTRFFISLENVANFILSMLTIGKTGSVFVPKMPSVSIFEMIKVLSGDVQVNITGIRPGEKIHEFLITQEESLNTIVHESHFEITKVFQRKEPFIYSSFDNDWWIKGNMLNEFLEEY